MTASEIFEAFDRVAGDGWAVIGAVARNAWAPPRATTDLDVAVAAEPAVVRAVGTALRTLGYALVREAAVLASNRRPR
ncbi:MAG: hypothetical protein KatS3mg076_2012 [Candidatus Binatia bacterium]|nr:MAG: hypothetical protein KatS3mg076_2012 [Candidatus Binatia bacterium]